MPSQLPDEAEMALSVVGVPVIAGAAMEATVWLTGPSVTGPYTLSTEVVPELLAPVYTILRYLPASADGMT